MEWKRAARGAIVVMWVAFVGGIAALPGQEREPEREATRGKFPDLTAVRDGIVGGVNDFRVQQKLPRLAISKPLTIAAQKFADFMARTDNYGHTADGKDPSKRAEQEGYEVCVMEENIAWEYRSDGFGTDELTKDFVTGWEQSPGHRKNMLSPDVIETGVGVAYSPRTQRYYGVQMFGRPMSAAIKFSVENDMPAEVLYHVDDQTHRIPTRVTITHTVCQSVILKFIAKGTDGQKASEQDFRPANGAKYVIQPAAGKQFEVVERVPANREE